ncbi:MAG: hypothetical protein E4H36_12390, partial [Spirochaetales bacterium]
MDHVVERSPGRICLLGDNADLIEKPALAAAVSAHITVTLNKRTDNTIIINSSDIDEREIFNLQDLPPLTSPLRYPVAVIQRLKADINTGFEAGISSEIPISAGLSSSTALVIAFIRAISRAYDIHFTPKEIAELSFTIESRDLGVECGRMDQYAIVFGGISYMTTDDNAQATSLGTIDLPILVADTQEKHDTKALQIWLRNRIAMKEDLLLGSLNRVVDIVEEGRKALEQGDLNLLGSLMNSQQKEEKLMGTSTERLELLTGTAREAGALGAKQMGAGGGGCIIALCTPESVESVKTSLE